MNVTFDYVLQRLKEPSTWTGLAAVLAVAGLQMSPESQDAFVEFFKSFGSVVAAGIAIIEIFWKKDSQAQP